VQYNVQVLGWTLYDDVPVCASLRATKIGDVTGESWLQSAVRSSLCVDTTRSSER
jgi:hypothetical protein